MKKKLHTDELPRFIYGKIKDFMIENDRVLPAVKVLKLCRDHAATVKYLYRGLPEPHAEKIIGQIDEAVIDHIAMQIRPDEKPIVLSEFPKIELQYKNIDKDIIAYRYVYFDGAFITDWKTRQSLHHLQTEIGQEAYEIVKSILDHAQAVHG